MDYVVGSIAALISGNVTPNRPKLIRRALTPTKHPSSPNVTPKSEFVEDRSIFLSPSVQKKKDIVKKSPKRIFENPDLDVTENSDSTSPKADKVKKHLKNELEADVMGKSNSDSNISPSNKLQKSQQLDYTEKKTKIIDPQVSNENTPKKKKRKSETTSVSDNCQNEQTDETTAVADELSSKSPKKMKQRRKSIVVNDSVNLTDNVTTATEKPNHTETGIANNPDGKVKKNKKQKKKNKQANKAESKKNEDKENNLTKEENKPSEHNAEAKSQKKKKNRKNKNKKVKTTVEEPPPAKKQDDKTPQTKDIGESEDDNVAVTEEVEKSDDENEDITEEVEKSDDDKETSEEAEEDSESDEEISNIPNPNAITEKDTDSEHDSDDEIESENEETNKDVLKTDEADESSDEESKVKTKKSAKQKKKEVAAKTEDELESTEDGQKEVNTEEEIKRTLFVGNVPFSNKCKKDIKRIFAQYGDIQTVRIRTVPVKDARVTPKLAVIKNEIHPDRSTVNVYIKFADAHSVEMALAENNTVLNHHHLRVSRSGATGVEHDPNCAVFLGNLPFGIEDETLRAKFEKCGEIESVRIVRDKKTNAGKGFGYVNFASKDGVELALELSEEDLTIKNRIIRVKRCTNTLSKGSKNVNKNVNQGPRKFGNNQGQNRHFGNNQGQNRNFGGNQGQRGNNQGPSRNFGNNQRNFGNNHGQNRNFGNNQGPRNFGNNQGPRNFGNNQNKFGNQGNNETSGASRRIMNKRPHQESNDGPPNKRQNVNQPPPPREKKQKKEFVGITAEKKKKQKFDKGQKKKKMLSEIMTKKA